MGSSPLDLYSRDYLNSLNSLAIKISTDIATAVAAYEDLWHTLSGRDQNQIVNETIIYPEVVLQYSLCKSSHGSEDEMCPEKPKTYGQFTCEGECEKSALWHDEHGVPFSWMTRSQLDLSIPSDSDLTPRQALQGTKVQSRILDKKMPISEHDSFIDPPNIVLGGSSSLLPIGTGKGKVVAESGSENDNLLSKLKGKTVRLKIQPIKMIDVRQDLERIPKMEPKEKEKTCPVVSCKATKGGNPKHISKPKNPPPPPPKQKHLDRQSFDTKEKVHIPESSLQFQGPSTKQNNKPVTTPDEALKAFEDFHVNINEPVSGDQLPKTGFDFLDNW